MGSANINLQHNTEIPNVVFTRPKYFILKNGFTALSIYDSNEGGFLCQNDQNVSHPWTFARVTEINNWSLIFLHRSTDPLRQFGVNGLAHGSLKVRGRSRAIYTEKYSSHSRVLKIEDVIFLKLWCTCSDRCSFIRHRLPKSHIK